jgi:hypothetical protein
LTEAGVALTATTAERGDEEEEDEVLAPPLDIDVDTR